MKTPKECRELARECVETAQKDVAPGHRRTLLSMAHTWLTMADGQPQGIVRAADTMAQVPSGELAAESNGKGNPSSTATRPVRGT